MGKLEDLIEQVTKLNKEEKYSEVIDILTDGVLEEYKSAELYKLRGDAMYASDIIDLAIQDYNNAIELKPHYADVYNNRGNSWFNKGEYDKAIEDYNKAIELAPNDEYFYNNLGNAWFHRKGYDMAIANYNKAIEVNPNYSDAHYNRGVVWDKKKEYDKALSDFTKALELSPTFAFAYNNRGNIWDNNREHDKAIADYSQAIKLKPDYAIAYYNRGISWHSKGEYDKAIADFTKALELQPDDAFSYYNRGVSWTDKGEYEMAISDYSSAIELNKDYEEPYNNRGVIWDIKGEYDKAIADYTQAIKINPINAKYYNNRADSYYDIKEFQKALNDYERAISLDTKYKYAEYRINLAKAALDKTIDKPTNKEEKVLYYIIEEAKKIADETKQTEVKKIGVELASLLERFREHTKPDRDFPVAHYTKLNVADILVSGDKDNTKLRYYNVLYMNDPEEGRVLIDMLDDDIQKCFKKGELGDENNIYLGSFMEASAKGALTSVDDKDTGHEDDLVMWRTYGRDEHNNEAAGCCLVIADNFFDKGGRYIDQRMRTSMKEEAEVIPTPAIGEHALFKVIYYNKRNGGNIVNDSNGKIKEDLDKMKAQLKLLVALKDGDDVVNRVIDSIVYRFLSELRYMFKSADYSYENEYRIIQYRSSTNKEVLIDDTTLPRKLYIESNRPLLPYLDRIILGPKVPNQQQWMYLETLMRRQGLDMKLAYSTCKFQ